MTIDRIRLAGSFRQTSPFAWLAFEATRPVIEGFAYRLMQWDELSKATDAGVVFG